MSDDQTFIPLADAFEDEVQTSELCIAAIRSIDSAATEPTAEPVPNSEESSELIPGLNPARGELPTLPSREPNCFEKYDRAARQIEQSMRRAIDDGALPVFRETAPGVFVQLERAEWRQMSFGIPGFEYVPHHLTRVQTH